MAHSRNTNELIFPIIDGVKSGKKADGIFFSLRGDWVTNLVTFKALKLISLIDERNSVCREIVFLISAN